MENLLFFQSTATTSARLKLEGVYAGARAHGWNVIRLDLHDSPQIRDEIRFWQPVGCIVEFATDNFALPRNAMRLLPSVLLDCNPRLVNRGIDALIQSPEAAGTAAADFLFRQGLSTYAYVGWPRTKFWDVLREQAFRRHLARFKRNCVTIRPHMEFANVARLRAFLSEQLRKMPKPSGIYCANDAIAVQVLGATSDIGAIVPDDFVVLGTDNEEFLCENATPTISSIEINFVSAGHRAVDIIADLVAGKQRGTHTETIGVRRIVERTSTRRTPHHDSEVLEVLDYIRAHANEGLTSAALMTHFSCSRRKAEQRFAKITGHSILDEIHAVQIEHAKSLLRNPWTKVSAVPTQCGHTSPSYFMRLFRQETGLTPSEWRKQHEISSAAQGYGNTRLNCHR